MRFAPWNENSRACSNFDFVRTHLDPQSAFENVPRLVVTMMKMPRRDQAPCSGRAAGIAPLGDYKGIINGTDDVAGKQRSNNR